MKLKSRNYIEVTEDLFYCNCNGNTANSLGVVIYRLASFLSNYDHAFVKGSTLKKLIVNATSQTIVALDKVEFIMKAENIIKILILEPIVFGKGIWLVTIQPQNTFEIRKIEDDTIYMNASGVQSRFVKHKLIKIKPDGFYVYFGKLFGWRQTNKFH